MLIALAGTPLYAAFFYDAQFSYTSTFVLAGGPALSPAFIAVSMSGPAAAALAVRALVFIFIYHHPASTVQQAAGHIIEFLLF